MLMWKKIPGSPCFSVLQISLVPRPHPAHVRRRGLVSQVEILGPAPEAWSCQSNRRVAFIGSENKYFNRTAQSDVMKFIIQHCNSTLTRLQHFGKPKDSGLWHQTLSLWEGWVWARDYCKWRKAGWGLGTRLWLSCVTNQLCICRLVFRT